MSCKSFLLFYCFLMTVSLFAFDAIPESGSTFLVLKSSPANMRLGPGINYPISWVYLESNIPFKVVDRFEDWIMVEDIKGVQGWIQSALLWSKKHVMSRRRIEGYRICNTNAVLVSVIGPNVMLGLIKCNISWCNVQINGFKMWVNKNGLWGV